MVSRSQSVWLAESGRDRAINLSVGRSVGRSVIAVRSAVGHVLQWKSSTSRQLGDIHIICRCSSVFHSTSPPVIAAHSHTQRITATLLYHVFTLSAVFLVYLITHINVVAGLSRAFIRSVRVCLCQHSKTKNHWTYNTKLARWIVHDNGYPFYLRSKG